MCGRGRSDAVTGKDKESPRQRSDAVGKRIKKLSFVLITWNQELEPPDVKTANELLLSIFDLPPHDRELPDIIAIGLQEASPYPYPAAGGSSKTFLAEMLMQTSDFSSHYDLISSNFFSGYTKGSQHLPGNQKAYQVLQILVNKGSYWKTGDFSLKFQENRNFLYDFFSESEKGCLLTILEISRKKIGFVSTHWPKPEKQPYPGACLQDILAKIKTKIDYLDLLFIMGDLNYRLSSSHSPDHILNILTHPCSNFKTLQDHDTFKIALSTIPIFRSLTWPDHSADCLPTYKRVKTADKPENKVAIKRLKYEKPFPYNLLRLVYNPALNPGTYPRLLKSLDPKPGVEAEFFTPDVYASQVYDLGWLDRIGFCIYQGLKLSDNCLEPQLYGFAHIPYGDHSPVAGKFIFDLI